MPVSVSMLSNGDLIVLSWIEISKFPVDDEFNFNGSGMMMRIDSTTGKTLWAKDILFKADNTLLFSQAIAICNDTIWSYSRMFGSFMYKVALCHIDSNGSIIKWFSAINPINAQQTNSKFFVWEGLMVTDSNSIYLYGETLYHQGQMGVSENSQIDATLFKYDSSMNIQWYTSMDFRKDVDYWAGLSTLNESVYAILESGFRNIWISELSSVDGTYRHSISIKPKYSNGSKYVKIGTIIASHNNIFVRDSLQDPSGYYYLLIFNSLLSLLKIFQIKDFAYTAGVIFEKNRYLYNIIYKIGNNINIIAFDENLNLNWTNIIPNDQSIGELYFILLALKSNNSFYLIYPENVTIDSDSTFTQAKISSYDFIFNSKGWNTNKIVNGDQTCALEIPFGYENSNDFQYNVINESVSVAYYQGTTDIASYDVTSDAYVVDLTDWIWPRFDWEFGSWSFPLPEFVLNPDYSIIIGIYFKFIVHIYIFCLLN